MEEFNQTLGAALVRRIFPEFYESDWAALFDLRQAAENQIDPFDFIGHKLGLSERDVFARAAKAIQIAFTDERPKISSPSLPVDRVDQLHDVRSVRGKMLDRDLLFVAPNFWRYVELTKRVAYNPALREQLCVIPPRVLRRAYAEQQHSALYQSAVTRLARIWPFASAHLGLPTTTRIMFLVIVIAVAFAFSFPPPYFEGVAMVLVTLLFLVPAAFRLACAIGGRQLPRLSSAPLLADAQLPIYTVLIPLRDEAILVEQLVKAMRALNYPAAKLDIKFVVEETSTKTIAAVEKYLDDIRFELITVPDSEPRTKPKAVNYALPFVRGEHLVIFDAEDIPEPDQLRKAATLFARNAELECLQATLVIDNANENALTALFAAEYAAQFGLIMPVLAHLDMPMPLGGTSNHFRTQTLRRLGAWDSFNVTEDADLGIRLSRTQMKCGILDSYTREEAPVDLWAWVKQRTRWMKGWMQTLLVHTKDFRQLRRQMSLINIIVFYIYVGGLVFAAPLHALFVIKFVSDLMYNAGLAQQDYAQFNMHLIVLVTGYLSAVLTAALGLWQTKQFHLIGWQTFLPIYWLMTSFATLRAALQLATKPFSWEKTTHARTQLPRFQKQSTPTQDMTLDKVA